MRAPPAESLGVGVTLDIGGLVDVLDGSSDWAGGHEGGQGQGRGDGVLHDGGGKNDCLAMAMPQEWTA